jgi:glucose/arabinose dehydrogenase
MIVRFVAAACAFGLVSLVGSQAANSAGSGLAVPNGVEAAGGFRVEAIARIPGARELAIAPNGDLLVGTNGTVVDSIADPEGAPREPKSFAHIEEAPDAGVAVAGDAVFVGTHRGVWRVDFNPATGGASGAPRKLGSVRDIVASGHSTTSVAVSGQTLYVAVGSDRVRRTRCRTSRASIQTTGVSGGPMFAKAVRIRNAIALATDPATGAVWAGVAGQDELEHGHPYEVFDPVSAHPGLADYGWPDCYENHRRAGGAEVDCSHQIVPRVVFPAYSTPIGAVFYPLHPSGKYAFPAAFAGGAFVTLHGSWHQPPIPPRVVFVALKSDEPPKNVDWSDPNVQWREMLGGFQNAAGNRSGRPTGVTVGREGSLFVADDEAGLIYRVRPR